MRLLIDTHTLLWWWSERKRLSVIARRLIEDGSNQITVSAASAWEIAIKQRIGKLAQVDHFQPDFPSSFLSEVATEGFEELPVSLLHGLHAGSYAFTHADPFDRLLAAQSELEGMPLVTRDPAFAAFPCQTLW